MTGDAHQVPRPWTPPARAGKLAWKEKDVRAWQVGNGIVLTAEEDALLLPAVQKIRDAGL